jgi:hypothetical protein
VKKKIKNVKKKRKWFSYCSALKIKEFRTERLFCYEW